MKRFINLLVIVAIAALIWWLAFSPTPQVQPISVPAGQVVQGQEAFARALSAGIFYEQNGILDQATASYKKAAESTQAEIAAAANSNLQRLALEQQDFFYNIRLAVWTATQNIAQALIYLVLAVLLILFLWQVVLLLPRRPGYLLQPFEDLTSDADGKHFHTLVAHQLAEIRQTQAQAKDQLFNSLEQLDFPLVSPEWDIPADVLSLLDTTKIGTVNLPLSGAVQAINKWMNRREFTIDGVIEPREKAFSVHFQITRSRDHSQVYHWDLVTSGEGSETGQLQAAAEEVAYRILFSLTQSQVQANSWRSMQLFVRGILLMQHGQDGGYQPEVLEKSLEVLNQCSKIDPGYQQAQFAQGMVLISLGKYQDAEDIFARITVWNEQNTPLRLASLYNLGLAIYHTYRRQRFENAEDSFNKVLVYFQNNPPADDRSKALLALAHCGLISIQTQRLRPLLREKTVFTLPEIVESILGHMDAAQKLAGNLAEVKAVIHFSCGIIKWVCEEVSDAADEFKNSLTIRPDYIDAYIYLAILKHEMKDEDEAIRLLLQTEQLKLPGNEYAMYRLGDIYETLKKPDAAQKAYLRAPGIAEARYASGRIFYANDDRLEALEEFKAATGLNSKIPEYWDFLAWTIIHPTLLDKDLLPAALEAAERALQFVKGTSNEWKGRDLIGWTVHYQKDMNRAVRELTLSIQLEKHKQNYYHLAAAWFEIGNLRKARENVINSLKIIGDGGHWQERAIKLLHEIEAVLQDEPPKEEKTPPEKS